MAPAPRSGKSSTRNPKQPTGAPSARRSAVYLLDQVLGDGRLMSELLTGGALNSLEPADRARAQRLANETLRGL